MKFVTNEKELSLTMIFGSDEQVTPLAIATLVQKGENKKLWSVVAVVPEQYRDLDCFIDWVEESCEGGMATFSKSVNLRKRSV